MDVHQAIAQAESILPGVAVDQGEDPRWQSIIAIGEFIPTDPEPVWHFILRWGVHPDEDLRMAVATCLLEHLIEHHFEPYFTLIEDAVMRDPIFARTFQSCWRFGIPPGEARDRFTALKEWCKQNAN